MNRYYKIWIKLTSDAAQTALQSRFGSLIFVIGKFLRFGFFFFFIFLLFSRSTTINHYSFWQMLFFFLTFNLIDTLPQLFLREVYRFRQQVVSGNFDYYLVKPISPLFRALVGGWDILDVPLLLTSIAMLIVAATHLPAISWEGSISYVLLIANAMLIAVGFHICVLSLGILTTEVDNAIMLYRDLTQMGRFPVDIYREPLRGFLTFIIPIGLMITFPAKALMGLLAPQIIFLSLCIGCLVFLLSFWLWNYALRQYSSASS